MVFRDKADLARGLTAPIDDQMKFDQRMGAQRLGQGGTRLVVPNSTHKNAARPERDQIAGDVTCAADHQFGTFDRNHRRGRFGRNAGDVAINELIQHQIADAKDRLLRERSKMFVEIVHRVTGNGRRD